VIVVVTVILVFVMINFMLLNKAGRETLVKFHWKPACGERCSLSRFVISAVGLVMQGYSYNAGVQL
jgi:hypothetical protein